MFQESSRQPRHESCSEQNTVEMAVKAAGRIAAKLVPGSKMAVGVAVKTVEGGCEDGCELGCKRIGM